MEHGQQRDAATPSSALRLEHVTIESLRPHPANPRRHSKKQIRKIAESIRAFGFRVPVLIDQNSQLICGHARVQACTLLGWARVPAIRVTDLSDAQIRALMIADNRLTELSDWDEPLLAENLKILSDLELEFEVECVGFEYGDIEQRILSLEPAGDDEDDADDVPDPRDAPPVTCAGDLWHLDSHYVFCGDSTEAHPYEAVLGGREAAMVITDPPYNLPARTIGQVSDVEHGDFEMAAGEMSSDEFESFLGIVASLLCRFSQDGSIHYLFMDWRHARELLAVGQEHYAQLKNLCVWVKDRPGMGSFYRGQHELVFVFKHSETAHRNHFGLGQYGRPRSNVWCYPSVRSMNATDGDPDGNEALRLHPTIKPVRLIEDAILDCSRRGEIVLDPFLGSGSTLIACEKAGRRCAGIEIAPRYVDVAIRRWEQWTGRHAMHALSGRTAQELAEMRASESHDE